MKLAPTAEYPKPDCPVEPGDRQIRIDQEVDVFAARLACGELAERLGYSVIDKYSVVISVSELATNILVHAGTGTITLRVVSGPDGSRGLEMRASDQGGGIEDVALALRDGYSTGKGLGCGLPGVGRLMSELNISSSRGVGTTVRAVKWLPQPGRSSSRRVSPPPPTTANSFERSAQ